MREMSNNQVRAYKEEAANYLMRESQDAKVLADEYDKLAHMIRERDAISPITGLALRTTYHWLLEQRDEAKQLANEKKAYAAKFKEEL